MDIPLQVLVPAAAGFVGGLVAACFGLVGILITQARQDRRERRNYGLALRNARRDRLREACSTVLCESIWLEHSATALLNVMVEDEDFSDRFTRKRIELETAHGQEIAAVRRAAAKLQHEDDATELAEAAGRILEAYQGCEGILWAGPQMTVQTRVDSANAVYDARAAFRRRALGLLTTYDHPPGESLACCVH